MLIPNSRRFFSGTSLGASHIRSALAMLTGSGIAAGAYPAWRAASLPVAATLREEAVA